MVEIDAAAQSLVDFETSNTVQDLRSQDADVAGMLGLFLLMKTLPTGSPATATKELVLLIFRPFQKS